MRKVMVVKVTDSWDSATRFATMALRELGKIGEIRAIRILLSRSMFPDIWNPRSPIYS